MTNKITHRIEVCSIIDDPRAEIIKNKLNSFGNIIDQVEITNNYLINYNFSKEKIEALAESLIQPVSQKYLINQPYYPSKFDYALEVGFLPGVTDNVSHTVTEIIKDKFKVNQENLVFSTITYFIKGKVFIEKIADELYNPLIERIQILSLADYQKRSGMGKVLPLVKIKENSKVEQIDLDLDDQELLKIGQEGILSKDGTRRGPLALDLPSMRAIKNYFLNQEKRDPYDIELESIAQTWSEHCKHTIFAADLDDDVKGGIFKNFIKAATLKIRKLKGKKDFCRSIFSDNAGGIEFDENYIISDKVETHNSPSALDPFGGSITGIVGVNRDEVGFGMGSKPIANRYGFCFANPFDEKPLYRTKEINSKMLSPRRIMEGVIQGVNVGGNHSGIPTPQGFVYFHDRYKGKPLVFVGTIGLIPKIVCGQSSVLKKAQPGDNIVMLGGRVGQDGIHGATFSSEALNSGSPSSAVQIGDPITQKKFSDALIKEARDLGLYNSITDNGAGGLSCSVAEMARESGGFVVNLEKIPLKYPGLSPWQIWVSESQERMTLSIADDKIEQFLALMTKRGVEATIIGKFNDSDRAIVYYYQEKIFDLEMSFLHDGLPPKILRTVLKKKKVEILDLPLEKNFNAVLTGMMTRLNVASYEFISYQYDHEVQGNSVLKPLQGKGKINGSTSIIRPILDSKKGVVLSQGMYPTYSELDPYGMAACSIDTAVRNIVAAGGNLEKIALLDNFCWCDSNNPERLGQLKQAARACYDLAVAYQTPYISGKDSMFNDFRGFDDQFKEIKISVPPTLLISSIGIIDNINDAQSLDFKFVGDLIYLIGLTGSELGGSEYLSYVSEKKSKLLESGEIPTVDPKSFLKIYKAFSQAIQQGLIASSLSLERGGLGVALAKSSLAGLLGCSIDLREFDLREEFLLFAESQGRILLSINPKNKEALETLFKGLPLFYLGQVQPDQIQIKGLDKNKFLVDLSVKELLEKHKNLFKGF